MVKIYISPIDKNKWFFFRIRIPRQPLPGVPAQPPVHGAPLRVRPMPGGRAEGGGADGGLGERAVQVGQSVIFELS